MSVFLRRIIICLLGIIGGLTAWPLAEILLVNQNSFPTFFLFSITQGAVIGLILGIFFGSMERMGRGILTGAVIGLAGGAVGFLAGQAVLFLAGGFIFSRV